MTYLIKVFRESLSVSHIIKSVCLFFCILLHTAVFSNETGLHKTTAERPFITTWKTDNPGSSLTNQITIPTTGTGYNYSIYWEDVTNATIKGTQTALTGNYTITFPVAGTYRVEISGSFPRIFFNSVGDKSKILSVNQWGTIAWTSMYRAFAGCNNLIIPATDAPDLSKVTECSFMFFSATSINQPVNHWDVSNVTDFSCMFGGASSFNQKVGSWNVSKATSIANLFAGATVFNQDISSWNVSNVTSMIATFSGAGAFNQNIGNWNVSKVTDARSMFSSATSFNQDISGWKMNLTSMNGMFAEAKVFNQDISSWNVSNVTDMDNMFYDAAAFNQPIVNWDVSKVTTMKYMFFQATSFNQNIGNWNVGNVTDMFNMFWAAESFNQNLGNWDIKNVTKMTGMLNYVGLSTVNYDLTLKGWLANPKGIKNNVSLESYNLNYCAGESARNALIKNHSWVITGDKKNCSQSITFGALEPKIVGDAPFNLTATSSSGQPVSYTSSNPTVASISGNTVKILKSGSTIITASVPASNFYTAASPVQQNLKVDMGTITGLVNTENPEIKIYPNPANDYLEIDLNGKQINTLNLLDLNGKNVLELNTTIQRVDISSLNSGVYFLNVGSEDKVIHYKILKD